MTRADKIRAMSDEELAAKLTTLFLRLQYKIVTEGKILMSREEGQKMILEVIQKPAMEEN